MTRRKKKNKTTIWLKEKGLYYVKETKKRKKEEKLQKEIFSADLTIAVVLVRILSVSCSLGGWSVQIQRLEEGEFWVPTRVESLLG